MIGKEGERPANFAKAFYRLAFEEPFYSFILLSLKERQVSKEEWEKIAPPGAPPTLATDGRHLFYNPEYVSTLTTEQAIAALCHEVGHIVGLDMYRREGREPALWNMAADYSINEILDKAGKHLHSGWLRDKKFDDKTREEIYALLMKNAKKIVVTFGDPSGKGKSQCPCGGIVDGEPGDKPKVQLEVQLAAQRAKAIGKLPGAFEGIIEEALSPGVKWQDVVHNFTKRTIKTKYDWRRPIRNLIPFGTFLPSVSDGVGVGHLAIVFDTSGSVPDEDLGMFVKGLNEVMEELKPVGVYLIQADYDVHSCDRYTPEDFPLPNIKCRGRGGTSFKPPFEHIEEKELLVDALIYFTDLEGDFPEDRPKYPVLWVATTGHEAPFGETVRARKG